MTVTVLSEIADILLRLDVIDAIKVWMDLADRAGEDISKDKVKELMKKVEGHMKW